MRGIPRVSLLVDRLRREYACNSLVFTQDRVGRTVRALGRIDRVLPDSAIVFRTDGGSGLWCASESPVVVASLKEGVWVGFGGRVGWLDRR